MSSFYIRSEVVPFIAVLFIIFSILALILIKRRYSWQKITLLCLVPACIGVIYLCYFFRDPDRNPPIDSESVVSGADGTVTSVTNLYEREYLCEDCVRVSIFLSLFDVHVNRAPISGKSVFLGYFPGKHLFTFQEKSSEVNQHNKIMIIGGKTKCLVYQIVGPVCRRVVYWLPHDVPTEVKAGDRIGMMKFGSRLDIYMPAKDVEVVTTVGAKVRAGETIIARIKK